MLIFSSAGKFRPPAKPKGEWQELEGTHNTVNFTVRCSHSLQLIYQYFTTVRYFKTIFCYKRKVEMVS